MKAGGDRRNLLPAMMTCGLLLVFLWIVSGPTGPSFGQEAGRKDKAEIGSKEQAMTDRDILSEEQGEYLLKVARRTIEEELFGRRMPKEGFGADLPDIFREKRGTFVTLTKGGNLRGCIGHIMPQEPLLESVEDNAVSAAFRDPRFLPMSKEEWDGVKIEVSVLTDPKPLAYSGADDLLDKLRPGIDGVIIKKGYHLATFLPQVWEQLPGKEEFLNHLCMKAGLPGDAWKKGDLEVSTYQVQAFEE
jgi:AmmeMemoRadiSam system protein A